MKLANFAALVALCLFVSVTANADVPKLINYQGRLTNTAGVPVPNSTYPVTFTIYNAPTGGINLWTETQTVTTNTGLFNVLLGSSTAFPLDLFSDTSRYIGIQVSADPELIPRHRLVSSPYSYRVSTVDGASGGTITSKVSIGPGHTNTGADAFVAGAFNSASGDYSTVGGGGNGNTASSDFATVGGGSGNTASSPAATVGGGQGNTASSGAATVGGGFNNTASYSYATVGGGELNTASFFDATVGGGRENSASASMTTVGGGNRNIAGQQNSTVGGGADNTASGHSATVGGGAQNTASGIIATVGGGSRDTASGDYSTVGGGAYNLADDTASTVSGGRNNKARGKYSVVSGGGGATAADSNSANGDFSAVGGGRVNSALGYSATVSGGEGNHAGGFIGTVGGGASNTANSDMATVGGGWLNTASGVRSTVGGGYGDTASGESATVGGGYVNFASGFAATIPGGYGNEAAGTTSFAAGYFAQANHDGSFVWSDLSGADFTSTGDNQFLIRASGGVGIGTATPSHPLHMSSGAHVTAGGTWTNASSRTLKTDIEPLNNEEYSDILKKLEELEVVHFKYKAEPDVEHIGMIAEDVPDEISSPDRKGIPTADAIAFLMAAVKAQQSQIEELKMTVKDLKDKQKDN